MKLKKSFLLFLQIILVKAVFAQPGANDGGFNTIDDCTYGDGTGFNNSVRVSEIQNDGKILIGGEFTTFNGFSQNRLTRLNTDGSLDTSFNIGSGFNGSIIRTIAIQIDGKILIGGDFTSFNGNSVNRIVRLNADGSFDPSFNCGAGFDGDVYAIILQTDGKALVGGGFFNFNGLGQNGIVRLNTNGSIDPTFAIGTGFFNSGVQSLVLQSDGKILAGGWFTSFNGNSRNRIARLNNDGSLDLSFISGSGFNANVLTLVLQPDGKIVVGGDFSLYNGTSKNRLARLNTDGTLDNTFITGFGFDNSVYKISLQSDGKIVLGGRFGQYNGIILNGFYVARLNSSGSIDNTFNPDFGFNNYIYTISIQTDGKIIFGGGFDLNENSPSFRIVRLNQNLSTDVYFNQVNGLNQNASSTIIQSDGKIIVGGNFLQYNQTESKRIVRLNVDGSMDTSFTIGSGFNNGIQAIALQSDGKIIVGGSFTSYNGIVRNRIVRLNSDGTPDNSFNPGTGFNSHVTSIIIQTDGKIIVGGFFTTFNNVTHNRLVRLNADGSIDATFNIGSGFTNGVRKVALQSDGKIMVVGYFGTFNGASQNCITRLNTDGSRDLGFLNGVGFDTYASEVKIASDGKILVGGFFNEYNGLARNRIIRLNQDGTVDNTFIIGTGFGLNVSSFAYVSTILIEPDEKIIIGGYFTSYNGISRNNIVRLNTDGSIDNNFDIGLGFNSGVSTLSLEPNGRIIAGGGFTSYDGNCRNRIARILNCYPSISSINASACDEYTLNGQSYTTSGTFTQNLFSIGGCDSTVTLNLTITNSTSNNMVVSSCSSYTLNGQTYDSTGVYNQLLQNSSGCDSLITLNLTILQTTETNLNETSCGAFTLNGQTYTNSGTFQQVLSNVNGCDSIITLNLTVNTTPSMNVTDNGDFTLTANTASSYQWINCETNQPIVGATDQTIVLTENGSYAVIGENAAGCVDTSDCVVVDYLSTTQNTLSNWSVYPNPTDDNVVVHFAGENMELSILDYQGKLLDKITVQPNTNISMSEFDSGVYFFEMEWNGKVEIIKIVKKN